MSDNPKCELCGEPMPDGESMFKFHGYSGPCPKPPLSILSSVLHDDHVSCPRCTYQFRALSVNALRDVERQAREIDRLRTVVRAADDMRRYVTPVGKGECDALTAYDAARGEVKA